MLQFALNWGYTGYLLESYECIQVTIVPWTCVQGTLQLGPRYFIVAIYKNMLHFVEKLADCSI